MTLSELIAKLEAATEGSRELDLELSEIVGRHGTTVQHRDARSFIERNRRAPASMVWCPFYTASLDAALTLVPDDLNCCVKRYKDGHGGAEIWRWSPELFADIPGGISSEELLRRNGSFTHQNIGARTPALALCIAALRAREK